MNLVVDPWIPAVRPSGEEELVSLEVCFSEAKHISALIARPHERIALMRLLICIAQAAGDWNAIGDYLQRWSCEFNLFGNGHRFLQFKTAKEKPKDSGLLFLEAASGNNPLLFTHLTDEEKNPTPAQCALALLTFQNFSPLTNGCYPGRAPAIQNNMVHCFRCATTLKCCLISNMLSESLITTFYGPTGRGKPVWEFSTDHVSDLVAKRDDLEATYLGRLVPVTRAIWLLDEGERMIMDNALTYQPFEAFREPTATVKIINDERKLVGAMPERALWRDLQAICVKRLSDSSLGAPLTLQDVARQDRTHLWIGALAAGRKASEKCRLFESIESEYSVPIEMFDSGGQAVYESGVGFSNSRSKLLRDAIDQYWDICEDIDKRSKRSRKKRMELRKKGAESFFWHAIEQHVPKLLAIVADVSLLGGKDFYTSKNFWSRAVRSAARAAYEHACSRGTPRQIQAFAAGLKKLHPIPKKKASAKKKTSKLISP
jgi:CRISPR system Cascade subunit CasA